MPGSTSIKTLLNVHLLFLPCSAAFISQKHALSLFSLFLSSLFTFMFLFPEGWTSVMPCHLQKLQLIQNECSRVLYQNLKFGPHYSLCCTGSQYNIALLYKILLLTYKPMDGLSVPGPSCLLRSKVAGSLLVPRIMKTTGGARTFPSQPSS